VGDDNWLATLYDFLMILNSNLGPILPRFRDITVFIGRKPLFVYTHPYSGQNFGYSPWSTAKDSKHPKLTNGEIIFEKF